MDPRLFGLRIQFQGNFIAFKSPGKLVPLLIITPFYFIVNQEFVGIDLGTEIFRVAAAGLC